MRTGLYLLVAGVALLAPVSAFDPNKLPSGLWWLCLCAVGLGGAMVNLGLLFIEADTEPVKAFPDGAGAGRRSRAHLYEDCGDEADIPVDEAPPAAGNGPDPSAHLIDLDKLPTDVAAALRPFLAPDERYIHPERLQQVLAEATRLLRERERFARQQTITLDWQNELSLSQACAAYLDTLSLEEQALLQIRLAADAHAARDCARMESEISELKQRLAEAEKKISDGGFSVTAVWLPVWGAQPIFPTTTRGGSDGV